jgi:hypothetical protein
LGAITRAGAGGAEQDHILLTTADAPLQLLDRGGLIARGLMGTVHLEPARLAGDLPDRAELGMG